MRIVVFGCQKIAIDVLKFILADGQHEVVGVVTHDEDRDRLFSDQLVSEFCFLNNVPSFRFDGKVDPNMIAALKPDVIFSTYYRKILSKDIIDLPKLGCINLHPGLLPRDRGPNPTYWNVRRGDRYAGVSLHYIDEGMDTGDIIAEDSMEIGNRTGFDLNRDMMEIGYQLFVDNFDSIMDGTNRRYIQDPEKATCNVKFTNNMRYIDWCQPAEVIVNHVRAHAPPYGGSLARRVGSEDNIMVYSAEVIDEPRSDKGPGFFEAVGDFGAIKVQTHTKPVKILWKAGDIVTAGVIINKRKGRFISGVPE